MTIDKSALRNAATVIVLRDRESDPHVLMGQRGATAAFMPNKFVFPGGAVDDADAKIRLARPLSILSEERLQEQAQPNIAHSLAIAAVRELWEETGQILGQKGDWDTPVPDDWTTYANTGHVPSGHGLEFVFRAITPPGRPRRFDARFFLLDAAELASDLDNFESACDELSHLQWISLRKAREFNLPFITEVVLAEVEGRLHDPAPQESVPFFKNNEEQTLFLRLKGRPQTAASD